MFSRTVSKYVSIYKIDILLISRYPTHFSICHSFLDIYIIGVFLDCLVKFSATRVIKVKGGLTGAIRQVNTRDQYERSIREINTIDHYERSSHRSSHQVNTRGHHTKSIREVITHRSSHQVIT